MTTDADQLANARRISRENADLAVMLSGRLAQIAEIAGYWSRRPSAPINDAGDWQKVLDLASLNLNSSWDELSAQLETM